jgi:hypothetical protein
MPRVLKNRWSSPAAICSGDCVSSDTTICQDEEILKGKKVIWASGAMLMILPRLIALLTWHIVTPNRSFLDL